MRILLSLLLLSSPVFAQDRDGNDTPGSWKVTHQQAFGLWDSVCDERTTGDLIEERCYLRYVDVFSPRPKFAAQFAFITPDDKVEFGIENGTAFRPDGFRLEKDGSPLWVFGKDRCLFGGTCRFVDGQARDLLDHMENSDAFVFEFFDRHGSEQLLEWDMSKFGDALSDMRQEAQNRGI